MEERGLLIHIHIIIVIVSMKAFTVGCSISLVCVSYISFCFAEEPDAVSLCDTVLQKNLTLFSLMLFYRRTWRCFGLWRCFTEEPDAASSLWCCFTAEPGAVSSLWYCFTEEPDDVSSLWCCFTEKPDAVPLCDAVRRRTDLHLWQQVRQVVRRWPSGLSGHRFRGGATVEKGVPAGQKGPSL